MSDAPEIAVTVIGGYLGAGKTTLLNHVLRTGDARIAVLVNDFGSVNIDQSLIVASDEQMITLDNGCICCSLADGLAVALDQVRGFLPRPERLVIEASGVGDPLSVAANAQGRGLRLDAIVTVVDAETFVMKSRDRYVGDVVIQQVRHADLLVLNKTDLVDAFQLAAVRSMLGTLVPTAPVIDTFFGVMPLELIFGLERTEASLPLAPPSTRSHDVDAVFVSWAATVDVEFDQVFLQHTLSELPKWVVRVKGVVCSASQRRLIVHRVASRVSVADDGPWSGGPSQLVAIGVRLEATAQNPIGALIAAAQRH